MDLQLKGKSALVTGSTKGIGYAIARTLAQEGASVLLNGRDDKRTGDAAMSLQTDVPGADVTAVPGDVSTTAGCEKVTALCRQADILINNAGIFEPIPFLDTTDEVWQRFYDVNVMSGVRLTRYYLRGMLERNWGRVIFVSSESGINIPQEMVHYGMTKTAQLAISRGVAEWTKGTGVTVNSILPGPTDSEGVGDFVRSVADEKGITFDEMQQQFFEHNRPTSLIQRFATPTEVANLAVYLASPLSSATNGAALRCDGGVVKACF
ncbi:MAG: SDR family NAD(P)-dependent oxidoreductase [Opitutales bacterium]